MAEMTDKTEPTADQSVALLEFDLLRSKMASTKLRVQSGKLCVCFVGVLQMIS